jgi:DNA-binding YbaB/EbfC family protein
LYISKRCFIINKCNSSKEEDFFMAKGGFPGGFGGGNMNNLMKQAQKLQKQMEDMQKEIELKEFEASVGGGAVVVKINGKKEVTAINIKPEVVDPDDVEMLEDLVLSAVNEAIKKAEDETANKMGKLTGGMPGLF